MSNNSKSIACVVLLLVGLCVLSGCATSKDPSITETPESLEQKKRETISLRPYCVFTTGSEGLDPAIRNAIDTSLDFGLPPWDYAFRNDWDEVELERCTTGVSRWWSQGHVAPSLIMVYREMLNPLTIVFADSQTDSVVAYIRQERCVSVPREDALYYLPCDAIDELVGVKEPRDVYGFHGDSLVFKFMHYPLLHPDGP